MSQDTKLILVAVGALAVGLLVAGYVAAGSTTT